MGSYGASGYGQGGVTVISALLASSGLPIFEARILACHALNVPRSWLIAHADEVVSDGITPSLESLFRRRREGEPIAYLTGEREFWGMSLAVSPEVLIPRPETELAVERVLELSVGLTSPRILDLGTGSGAIAIALARERPDAKIWASDASSSALAIAKGNAMRHAVRVEFACGEWFAPLHDQYFDIIVSNPPYITDSDPHLSEGDLRYEPRAALVGGRDGLDCVRHIADAARAYLVPGGWLVLEHGYDQGEACVRLLEDLGYGGVRDNQDLAGHPRICSGRIDAAAARRYHSRVK